MDEPPATTTTTTTTITTTTTSVVAPLLTDVLFNHIEEQQATTGRGFGRLLDAGTGNHSLRWIAGLIHAYPSKDHPSHVAEYTAVTADERMRKNVSEEAQKLNVAHRGDVVVGNWFPKDDENDENNNNSLLRGRTYDTILADYLVGAMDGFSPYYQDRIFPRLLRHLAPGGRLYVVGLQPVPDSANGDADVVCRVTKTRDACIDLAGHRRYREYPLDWIVRTLNGCGGGDVDDEAGGRRPSLRVTTRKTFPILYSPTTITRQINVARSKLTLFKNTVGEQAAEDLSRSMAVALDGLEREAREACERAEDGRIRLGFDYVVCAERTD